MRKQYKNKNKSILKCRTKTHTSLFFKSINYQLNRKKLFYELGLNKRGKSRQISLAEKATYSGSNSVCSFQAQKQTLKAPHSNVRLGWICFIVSNLKVKQWCVSEQFIAINDKLEKLARDFISNGRWREESKTAERQRERVC